jgi:hypothetical protein
MPQLEPVDLTVASENDAAFLCGDLLMPNITAEPPFDSVDTDDEFNGTLDDQGYSVASGDHNYISVVLRKPESLRK